MGTPDPDNREHPHPVRHALSAAGEASAELLATMFADSHHESWEDAVHRYDAAHPAGTRPQGEPT